MIVKRSFLFGGLCCLLALGPGCVMKRTVTDGGSVVSENYVVKRPIRDSIAAQQQPAH